MKKMLIKIFLCTGLCCISVGAMAKEMVKDFEKAITKTLDNSNIRGKILESGDIDTNLKYFIIELDKGGVELLFSNTQGSAIFSISNLIASSAEGTKRFVQAYEHFQKTARNVLDAKILQIFSENEGRVFAFKSKKQNAKTLYIVLDPMCPYCIKELDRLDTRLKEANVKIMLIGFLSDKSLQKASEAYRQKQHDEVKNKALLKKIFTSQDAPKTYEKDILSLSIKFMELGLKQVPYIIEQ